MKFWKKEKVLKPPSKNTFNGLNKPLLLYLKNNKKQMKIPKIEKIKSNKVDLILKLIKAMDFTADEYDELADNCNEKYLIKTIEL